jgi:uncharacterized membrane protein YeaQ/YmgE (transglycosylase-associated protein family)
MNAIEEAGDIVKRIARYCVRHVGAFALGAVALGAVLMARQWIVQSGVSDTEFLRGVSNVIVGVVVGIVASLIAGEFLNHQFLARTDAKIGIVGAAQAAGIESLYATREEALTEMRDLAMRAGNHEINILSIAGKSYLRTNGVQDKLQESQKIFDVTFQYRLKNRRDLDAKIILVDPTAGQAIERSEREVSATEWAHFEAFHNAFFGSRSIEEISREAFKESIKELMRRVEPYRERANCQDFKESIRMLINLHKTYGLKKGRRDKASVSVRLSSMVPPFQLVRIGRHVFIEPYHLGRDTPAAETVFDRCLARRMPVVRFSEDSSAGKQTLDHFNQVWRFYADREVALDHSSREEDTGAAEVQVDARRIYLSELNRRIDDPDVYLDAVWELQLFKRWKAEPDEAD